MKFVYVRNILSIALMLYSYFLNMKQIISNCLMSVVSASISLLRKSTQSHAITAVVLPVDSRLWESPKEADIV